MTQEQLEERLRQFPDVVRVEVVSDGLNLVAKIIASSFEGEDDGERQARVYAFLYERFSYDEMNNLEFVFTDAPSEAA